MNEGFLLLLSEWRVPDPSKVEYHMDVKEPYAEIHFNAKEIKSRCLQDLGEIDSASGESFRNFLIWGMKNYPAEHYLVITNNHW